MNSVWWTLPGPAKFVSHIVGDMRDGRNIVICMPEFGPKGIRAAVRRSLGEPGAYQWHNIDGDLIKNQSTPLNLIYDRIVCNADPQKVRTVETLVKEETFQGKIIWVENITGNSWPLWKELLVEYEPYARSKSLLDRTLFCCPLEGEIAIDPIGQDVCLSLRKWSGIVNRLDMLIYAASMLEQRDLPPLQSEIAVMIITGLALWDAEVCDILAQNNIENILHPVNTLREIGGKRGWTNDGLPKEEILWHRNMKDIFDGNEEIHSAVLALSGNNRDLNQRIWAAEVGVMLPFVEQQRRMILSEIPTILKKPFMTRFGEKIEDPLELEIGHIDSIVANDRIEVRPAIRRMLPILRDIRNRLSHLETLNVEHINQVIQIMNTNK